MRPAYRPHHPYDVPMWMKERYCVGCGHHQEVHGERCKAYRLIGETCSCGAFKSVKDLDARRP